MRFLIEDLEQNGSRSVQQRPQDNPPEMVVFFLSVSKFPFSIDVKFMLCYNLLCSNQ